MKKISAASLVVLAAALCIVLLCAPASSQQAHSPSLSAVAQDQSTPPQANPPDPIESNTFTGKIVKPADKLVLTDTTGKTVYQLDDQIKAKEFLNRSVKVTGVLDSWTNVIHVSAIDSM